MIKNYFFQVKSVYNFVNKGRQSRCNECFFFTAYQFFMLKKLCATLIIFNDFLIHAITIFALAKQFLESHQFFIWLHALQ